MKSVKFLFVFAFLAISAFIVQAQVNNINDATFFKAKYKKDKVWDVQRLPAYPVAGQDWILSGLKGSLESTGATVDWGQDRYVMIVAEVDNTNGANSLVNDVTSSGGKYTVSLKLFESNGTLVKVISKWGKIAGIGEKGFMYEVEGRYGTFFSVSAVPSSTVIKYKPTLAVISRLSEVVNSSELTRSLEKESGIRESAFFSNKYTKENVWDVQRSPAYPVAGQVWTLSGLKGSLESSGASVDWGVGRYVMLVAEVDNANGANSLVDDINKNGTKLNVSLKLYESNGTLVKLISKWGKIYGIGAEGFMYEVEGRYGTFFSVAKVTPSTVIKYTPTLAAVTKLSDVTKGLNVTGQETKKVPELSKNITETPFFSNKYTKENVWDVQRSPAYPVAGQVWTLSGLKGSLESSGASVDWGNGRYVMLVAELDNANAVNSIVDDINKNGSKYNISLKLFESNGTFVKVISKWGKIYGMGAEGFMYEVEGKYGTFFSVAKVTPSTVIKYTPTLSAVTKLSDVTKGLNVTGKDSKIVPELSKNITETPFFSNKYTKENVWDVQRSPAYPVVGQVWTLSGLKGSLDASGASVNWGVGRYVMLVAELDNLNAANSIVDDINKNGSKYNISLRLFESNGTLVKVLSKWGKMYGIGAEGFMYEVEGKYGTFFSVAQVTPSTVVKYTPRVGTVNKLSDVTKVLNAVQGSGGKKIGGKPVIGGKQGTDIQE